MYRSNHSKQFISLTGASQKQAQHYLSKAKGNMQNAINLYFDQGGVPEQVKVGELPQIQSLFKKLSAQNTQNTELIGEDGFQQILQILKIDLTNPVIGFIMVNAMKMEKAGEIKKIHLYNLMQYCRASSMAEVASKVSQLQKQMRDRKDLFKNMYDGLFILYSVTKSPTLDYDVAQQLWRVYLADIMPMHKPFMQYVDTLQNKPAKIHKDLWRMVYQFAVHIDSSYENYKQSDGWPVFLDDFIEYEKAKMK